MSLILPPIADDQGREEREFWTAFEAAWPKILGALLDAVAAGLRHLTNIRLARRPRMVDFATWGEACAAGSAGSLARFCDYEENRSDAVAAAAEGSPLVPVIEAVLGRTGLDITGFDGTAAELLERLGDICGEPERRTRWYPATPSQLGSALCRIAPLLRSRAIDFQPYKDRDKKRTRRIILRCVSEAAHEELRARVMGKHRGAGD